ncbi:peptidylprolyl isomerase [Kinneretia aquatilis]|uniref:peptidylprolyl isomerase n=1 Tax=Kinneretia aquatilis TaxID=2070761 RepID=UPI0014950793|nr:peptidylprolyl isomerase [Paucibacter aquatile]WIV96215.1 peptidylprolyl isomerase [Paucibacter aquatile]
MPRNFVQSLSRRLALFSLAALAVCSAEAQAPLAAPASAAAVPQINPTVFVRLSTSEGEIRIGLDADKAPKTVANFLQYVKAGHYNGLIFHRVIENFMIQGGGFTKDLQQRPTKPPIPLESRNGLKNLRGTLAMARTSDPNSATSQFFINTVDNAFLDADNSRDGNGYAVFGQVLEGMDVVDKIRATPTTAQGPHQNLPQTPITITKALVEPKK